MYYNELSSKHKLFVDAYIETSFNGGEAYRKAGYKVSTADSAKSGATRLLAKANIRHAIAERLEPDRLSRDLRIKQASEELERLMLREPQIVIKEGEAYEETPDYNTQLKAIENILKYYPTDEHTDTLKDLEIELRKAELEIRRAQAEAIKSGDSALELINLDIDTILAEYNEEEDDSGE